MNKCFSTPNIRIVYYRCNNCNEIFTVFKRDKNYEDIFSLFNCKKNLCKKCNSSDVELWNPSRGYFQPLFGENKACPINGSIVCCDYKIILNHYGIYYKDLGIIHVPENEHYCIVSDCMSFISGNSKITNPCINIYVSCNNGNPISFDIALNRAISQKNLLEKKYFVNSEDFIIYCLTGKLKNTNYSSEFLGIEGMMGKFSSFNSWRQWKF